MLRDRKGMARQRERDCNREKRASEKERERVRGSKSERKGENIDRDGKREGETLIELGRGQAPNDDAPPDSGHKARASCGGDLEKQVLVFSGSNDSSAP